MHRVFHVTCTACWPREICGIVYLRMGAEDEIFQYSNEYTESPEYTKSIQTSLRSLLSIPKSHPRVTQKDTAVNQISQGILRKYTN